MILMSLSTTLMASESDTKKNMQHVTPCMALVAAHISLDVARVVVSYLPRWTITREVTIPGFDLINEVHLYRTLAGAYKLLVGNNLKKEKGPNVALIDLKTGEIEKIPGICAARTYVPRDGTRFAFSDRRSKTGQIYLTLYNPLSNKKIGMLNKREVVNYSFNRKLVVTSELVDQDGADPETNIVLWSVDKNGAPQRKLKTFTSEGMHIDVSPDGETIIAEASCGGLTAYSVQKDTQRNIGVEKTWSLAPGFCAELVCKFSPRGTYVLCLQDEDDWFARSVLLLDPRSGDVLHTIKHSLLTPDVHTVMISDDEQYLLFSCTARQQEDFSYSETAQVNVMDLGDLSQQGEPLVTSYPAAISGDVIDVKLLGCRYPRGTLFDMFGPYLVHVGLDKRTIIIRE